MATELPVGVVSRIRAVASGFEFRPSYRLVEVGDEIDVYVCPVKKIEVEDKQGNVDVRFERDRSGVPANFDGEIFPEGQTVPDGFELVTTTTSASTPPVRQEAPAAPASPPAGGPKPEEF